MSIGELKKQQFWLLAGVSVLLLLAAPSAWWYTPDGGVYIGTAQSIVRDAAYWFNGHPNLHYYPGFSLLLAAPIAVLGLDFPLLHLLCAGIVVGMLWLVRAYFDPERLGYGALAVPLLLAGNSIVQQQVVNVLAGGTFLVVVLGALFCWRTYLVRRNPGWLVLTALLAAAAPLIRFEGLFLTGAFGLAVLVDVIVLRERGYRRALGDIALASASLLPFVLWTWRNYVNHDPDTFNMANHFFFGLKGLAIYDGAYYRVEWIDAEWKYGIYNTLFNLRELLESFIGNAENLLSLEASVALVALLVVPGVLPWLRQANSLERAFVIAVGAFTFWRLLHSTNLYIVERYWLALLPFVALMGALGAQWWYRKASAVPRLQHLVAAAIALLGGVAISGGVTGTLAKYDQAEAAFYRTGNETLRAMGELVRGMTSEDTVVAATDWGAIPLYLGRNTIQLINDDSHLTSLGRISRYRAEMLVVLDGNAAFWEHARRMVDDLPELFSLVRDFVPEGPGPRGTVYRVDLPGVDEYLRRVEGATGESDKQSGKVES